jgi:hypothetical protein
MVHFLDTPPIAKKSILKSASQSGIRFCLKNGAILQKESYHQKLKLEEHTQSSASPV